ncbi:hypothetical protein GUITHDRAFT_94792, partial [Guillardia theta CCMP2712]
MESLHAQNVVAMDLKPQNILWEKSSDGVFVSDLGTSRQMDFKCKSFSPGQVMGTPNYISPEAWSPPAGGVTTKTDVWSFGCTLLEMSTGRMPWETMKIGEIMRAVCEENKTPDVSSAPPAFHPVLMGCFMRNPVERPSFGQLADSLRGVMQELEKQENSYFATAAKIARGALSAGAAGRGSETPGEGQSSSLFTMKAMDFAMTGAIVAAQASVIKEQTGRLKSTITASSFVKDLKKKGANMVAETITERLKSKSSQYQDRVCQKLKETMLNAADKLEEY